MYDDAGKSEKSCFVLLGYEPLALRNSCSPNLSSAPSSIHFLPKCSTTLLPQMVSQKILFCFYTSLVGAILTHAHRIHLLLFPLLPVFILLDDDGEMIIDQPCFKAEKTETAYWTADYRPEIKEKLKKADKVCRNEKCGECEGYCEKDSGRCQVNNSLYSLRS